MDIDGYAQPTRCTSIRGSRREIAATVLSLPAQQCVRIHRTPVPTFG
jgi:hypothetical protein